MPWNRLLRFGKGGLGEWKPWTKMCRLQSLLKFTKSGKVTRFWNLLFAYVEQKLAEKLAAKVSKRWVFVKCVPQRGLRCDIPCEVRSRTWGDGTFPAVASSSRWWTRFQARELTLWDFLILGVAGSVEEEVVSLRYQMLRLRAKIGTGWGGLKTNMPIAWQHWGEVAGSKEREQVFSEIWVAARALPNCVALSFPTLLVFGILFSCF